MLRWGDTLTLGGHRHLPGVPARRGSLASPAKNHIRAGRRMGAHHPKQPHLPPRDAPHCRCAVPSLGYLWGWAGRTLKALQALRWRGRRRRRHECSHWCWWWLVWDHRTFPPSQPTSPHHIPTHRLPLGASQPSLTRETLAQETGTGSAPGRVTGSAPGGGTVRYSPGHRPCPSRQAPLAHPVGHPHPAVGTGTGL